MLTDETRLPHIARDERQRGRAAAGRFHVRRRRGGDALVPDLPFMPQLRGEAIRTDERMRKPPGFSLKLTEGLRQPATEGQIVEIPEDETVFFPQEIKRGVGIKCHQAKNGGK